MASANGRQPREQHEALEDPEVPLVVLDLASVETYLLVQPLAWLARQSEGALWYPLQSAPAQLDLDRDAARLCAERIRLSLNWPARHPAPVPRTMRLAALASSLDRASSFMFTASGLAFGSGVDLERIEPGCELAAELTRELDAPPKSARAASEAGSEWDRSLGVIAHELGAIGISSAPALRWRGAIYRGAREIDTVLSEGESLQPRLGLGSTAPQ